MHVYNAGESEACMLGLVWKFGKNGMWLGTGESDWSAAHVQRTVHHEGMEILYNGITRVYEPFLSYENRFSFVVCPD